jgi:hypothetical protein
MVHLQKRVAAIVGWVDWIYSATAPTEEVGATLLCVVCLFYIVLLQLITFKLIRELPGRSTRIRNPKISCIGITTWGTSLEPLFREMRENSLPPMTEVIQNSI